MRKPLIAGAGILACLIAASLFGAPPPAQISHILVPVWPEARGEGGSALDPHGFEAKVDGKPAHVLATRGPNDDLMVILVLDLTGDLSLVEPAKEAAIAAVRALPPKTTVAILRAQDGMQVALDPTADREAAARIIRDMPASGKAGFLDTVEDACRIVTRILASTKVRAAVAYLTDSSIYNYRDDYTNPVINSSDSHDLSRRFPDGLVKEKITSLESKISTLQAPLFLVQLAYRTNTLEQSYQTGQLQLASASGGRAWFCRSSAEIPEAVSSMFGAIASHYSIDVRMPSKLPRVVQVQIENGAEPLTYRSRYTLE